MPAANSAAFFNPNSKVLTMSNTTRSRSASGMLLRRLSSFPSSLVFYAVEKAIRISLLFVKGVLRRRARMLSMSVVVYAVALVVRVCCVRLVRSYRFEGVVFALMRSVSMCIVCARRARCCFALMRSVGMCVVCANALS